VIETFAARPTILMKVLPDMPSQQYPRMPPFVAKGQAAMLLPVL
jgi:hypothetical protein